jgi:hypothetical protein
MSIQFLDDIIKNENITQIHISRALNNHKKTIFSFIEYEEYNNTNENTIFWGVYDRKDLNNILNHNSKCWILWFKDDCNPNYESRRSNVYKILEKNNIVHLCLLNNTKKFLNHYDINPVMIRYDKLIGTYKPRKIIKRDSTPYSRKLYGFDINNYDIINNVEKIPDCDILNSYKIDVSTLFIDTNTKLDICYDNISKMLNILKNYKNILLLCSDHPGYGGAATNCNQLQLFLNKHNHNTFSIYYNFNNDKNKTYSSNDYYRIVDQDKLMDAINNCKFTPDLIILRNTVPIDINIIKNISPVYYIVAGIYKNKLDTYFHNITHHNKYINETVLNQIKGADKSFISDLKSQQILKNRYNLKTHLFYSNLVSYYNTYPVKKLNSNNKYTYGIIVSDCNRKIKNVDNMVNQLIQYNIEPRTVIIVGNGSEKYKEYGFNCFNLMTHDDILKLYDDIMYIYQDSYYESCSNVFIECLFKGCSMTKSIVKNTINSDHYTFTHIKSNILNANELHVKIFSSNEILCISNNITELDYVKKLRIECEKLNIKIKILFLNNKTQFIHDYGINVKIIDIYRKQDIQKYVSHILNNNNYLDTVIYEQTEKTKYITDIIDLFRNKINNPIKTILNKMTQKLRIFFNFAFTDKAYGGGNQWVSATINFLNKFDHIEITCKLEKNPIDIYVIIDPRKDRHFKKYSFDQIYNHREKYKKGKILYRVNDCDITRTQKRLECMIVKYIDKFDHMVYNSQFIKEYYVNKYNFILKKPTSVIYNTVNRNIYYPKKRNNVSKKIRLITHHWSDNINKGYDMYYKLAEWCKNRDDYEFIFVGRKFNDKYDTRNIQIKGPYSGKQMADELRAADIYVTASIYDAGPMHVVEGLACGLPMLYINHIGGTINICQLNDNKIGEQFSDFQNMLTKLDKIKNNYEYYYNNIIQNMELYNSDKCFIDYYKLFLCIK